MKHIMSLPALALVAAILAIKGNDNEVQYGSYELLLSVRISELQHLKDMLPMQPRNILVEILSDYAAGVIEREIVASRFLMEHLHQASMTLIVVAK